MTTSHVEREPWLDADPATAPDAGSVILGYIAEQRLALLAGDAALRSGDDSAIHKTRVATRRLRSTLRTFAGLVDRPQAIALDAELRWLAALMGEVRDRQVLRKRLGAMVSALDETVIIGPVQARIDGELGREQAEHWALLLREMTGQRYLALLAEVAAWVSEPPLTPKARRKASSIRKYVDRADLAVSRRLAKGNESGDAHQLHRARKAAKRARYAAEAAEPVIGAKATAKQASRYEKLQDLLGEHQDSLVSADVLRRLGAQAGATEGESGFTFGILYECEQQSALHSRQEAQRLAKQYL